MVDNSMRRKLTDDVDISTMLSMRQQGMTNKQIAFALGVSPTTIYRYIGRKSDAVKVAQMQNREPGSVIPPQPWERPSVVAEPEQPKYQEQQMRKKPRHKDTRFTAPEAESATFVASETVEVYDAQTVTEEVSTDTRDNVVEFEERKEKVEAMPKETKKNGALRVISTRSTLQGSLCKYIVDTDSDSIEIDGGSILTGLLDKSTLCDLIDELNEIKSMFVY